MEMIESSPDLKDAFAEGKMLGVLVVGIPGESSPGFLAAFSGNVGGKSIIDGFVPPIYDLCDPDGYFKIREKEISQINTQISEYENSTEYLELRSSLAAAEEQMSGEIFLRKARMAELKRERDTIRRNTADPTTLQKLTRESQFEKAELKRIRSRWEEKTSRIQKRILEMETEIRRLKHLRKRLSDSLQEWIFTQYRVHNATGEESSVLDLFREHGLTPPGGTGDCAAPKLLEYAFRHDLKPLAMGEFWYGRSPATAVRTQGRFYPSCTSKCGPLLKYMMKGLDVAEEEKQKCILPEIIYEDRDILVTSKRSGTPSVPGLDGRKSLLEILQEKYPGIESVHRLDMDTSGIMVFALNPRARAELRRQFEEHTVNKTYLARLSAAKDQEQLKTGDTGRICLPMNQDYDERPRQKLDDIHGKPAVTDYIVSGTRSDGSIDVVLHPHTGRTHQLRVHCAHIRGLGHPIEGDLLYGGSPASRLCLHASAISFLHPSDRRLVTFEDDMDIY